jgi:hypothetical protein
VATALGAGLINCTHINRPKHTLRVLINVSLLLLYTAMVYKGRQLRQKEKRWFMLFGQQHQIPVTYKQQQSGPKIAAVPVINGHNMPLKGK